MRCAFVAAAAVLCMATTAAADKIAEIVVEDNVKTTSETVAFIAHLSVGDDWTPDLADKAREYLVTSGLFKDVDVFYDTVPSGIRVHLIVKDKHSWIVAPAFYNQPTNFGGGIGFGENNLAGLNQKLLLYAQVATGDSFFVGAWVIPSIGGTHLYAQVDTYLDSGREIEYAAPTKYVDNPGPVRLSRMAYLNGGLKLGYEPFHGIKIDDRIRAAYVSYSDVHLDDNARIQDVTGDPTSDPMKVPKPGSEGWDVSDELTFTVDRRADWYGIQSGYLYSAQLEFSLPALGSDFRYWDAHLSFLRAMKILDHHNLVYKGGIDYGHHLPFQQEFTTGGTSMRGWLNNQFRGDFHPWATVEYSVPLFTVYGLSVRGLGFWDSAYTTFLTTTNPERDYLPNSAVRGLDGFKNSVGVGTRLYLRQVVLPLLGLDFGYGLEARDFQIYLAVGLTN
ncbi:MAG TPA: BamA/TamA family outer membrane protein [Kofleriaceae bacterium]